MEPSFEITNVSVAVLPIARVTSNESGEILAIGASIADPLNTTVSTGVEGSSLVSSKYPSKLPAAVGANTTSTISAENGAITKLVGVGENAAFVLAMLLTVNGPLPMLATST